MKHPISPRSGPIPKGPYTPGIVASGRLLFVSGQLPIDPSTNELVDGPLETQVRQAIANVQAVVDTAGGSLSGIVKVNVYLRDIADGPRVNEIYAQSFPEPYPARTTTQSPLPRGAAIEIDAVVSLE